MSDESFPLNREEMLRIVDAIDGDGHGIYSQKEFAESCGIRPEQLNRWTRDHVSNPEDHKQTIYATGTQGFPGQETIEHMVGVYGLSLIEGIAEHLGLPTNVAFGRGSRCRILSSHISHALSTD